MTTTKGQLAGFQGMWSETYIITLEDDSKAVIQFRAEPLEIAPFQRAQKLLGSYCPTVELLHDKEGGVKERYDSRVVPECVHCLAVNACMEASAVRYLTCGVHLLPVFNPKYAQFTVGSFMTACIHGTRNLL